MLENDVRRRLGSRSAPLIAGALLVAAAVVAAAAAARQEPTTTPPAHRLSDDEKVANWKGESVVLLPSYHPRDFWGDYSSPGDRAFDCYRDGEPSTGLPYQNHVWKTGVVTEIRERPANRNSWPLFDVVVTLDGSGEKIVVGHPRYLGFDSERESASGYAGQPLWSKSTFYLVERSTLHSAEADRKKIEIKNTQKVTVSGVEWGEYNNNALLLCVKDGDGREGCFGSASCFDSRFHLLIGSDRCADTDGLAGVMGFYGQDPRAMHPGWSATIWNLIEKETVAIGMTEDMAKMACGGIFYEDGAILEDDKAATITSCRGQRFLIQAGRVTKFVVAR